MTLRDHLGPRTDATAALHDELDALLAAPAAVLMEAASIARECVFQYADPVPPIRALTTPESTAALKRVIEKALRMAAEGGLQFIVNTITKEKAEVAEKYPLLYQKLQNRRDEMGNLGGIQVFGEIARDILAITADDVLREMTK